MGLAAPGEDAIKSSSGEPGTRVDRGKIGIDVAENPLSDVEKYRTQEKKMMRESEQRGENETDSRQLRLGIKIRGISLCTKQTDPQTQKTNLWLTKGGVIN